MRFGEADRILHLYSADRGRINAIAKGSRKPRSRFGGRLEPFFRLDLLLYQGRSDLLTVTGAATVDGYPALRGSGPAIGAAARACDAMLRLFDSIEPNPPAYGLLCRYLTMLDEEAGTPQSDHPARPATAPPSASGRTAALAFRLKLALAAGFEPELNCCAHCGERDSISAFSGAAGGVVCASCEGGGFPLTSAARRFMLAAARQPLAELPTLEPVALRQVERAIGDVLSYHAHVQLRSAA